MSWWEERISNDQAERDKLARNQAIRERMRKDATKIRQHHGWAGRQPPRRERDPKKSDATSFWPPNSRASATRKTANRSKATGKPRRSRWARWVWVLGKM